MKSGQTVFITGISKGIGKSIAEYLVEKGYSVIGSCRNPDALTDKIPNVRYLQLDQTDEKSIAACVENLGQIDVLINNAGQSQLGSLEEIAVNKIREIFEINYFGLVSITQKLIPVLRKGNAPKIINIGSMIGSFPLPYYSGYGATKAATKMMSFCLRHELKHFGVKVTVLEPNDIKTTIAPDTIIVDGSDYYNDVATVRQKVKEKMQKAHDPVVVAEKVFKILKKKRLRSCYVVGGAGPYLTFWRRFTPEWLVEFTVRKMYGLK